VPEGNCALPKNNVHWVEKPATSRNSVVRFASFDNLAWSTFLQLDTRISKTSDQRTLYNHSALPDVRYDKSRELWKQFRPVTCVRLITGSRSDLFALQRLCRRIIRVMVPRSPPPLTIFASKAKVIKLQAAHRCFSRMAEPHVPH